MSTETTQVAPQGDAGALPAVSTTPAPVVPKSDAEAEQLEAALAKPPAEPEAKPEGEDSPEQRKKNKTRAYIEKLHSQLAEKTKAQQDLEARLRAIEERVPQPARRDPDAPPTLEDCDWDPQKHAIEAAKWATAQAAKQQTEATTKKAQQDREQQLYESYLERARAFAADHEDFLEVVGSITYPLSPAQQAAIAAHELGPAIAYHLGNEDDDAFELARTPDHLVPAMVDRIARRLQTAPPAQSEAPAPALAAVSAPKPTTKAPPPPQTVGGRAVTEVPPQKLTDEQWLKREREREQARRRG